MITALLCTSREVLAFFVSLVLALAAIRVAVPMPYVPEVSDKLRYFAEHRDEFDTLFIGSSRVYRQIFPRQFDELLAANGVVSRSFNFGVNGMFPPEDAFVCAQIFALHPQKLKRVFIELSLFANPATANNPDSIRNIYWRDTERTARLVGHAFDSEKPQRFRWQKWRKSYEDWSARSVTAAEYLRLFVKRQLNIGSGADWLAGRMNPVEPKPLTESLGTNLRGDLPLTDSPMRAHDLEEFRSSFAARQKAPAQVLPFSRNADRSLQSMIAAVRSAGATPILFVSPSVSPQRFYPRDREAVPVLDFADIEKFPELYREELWHDIGHLNARGSELYTQRFAERFLLLK